MKTTVEKLNPTRVKLIISVPPEELKPSITSAYSAIAQQISIPGFRKGKVPPAIIDQRVGKGAVIEQAVSEGLDEIYRKAVAEEDIKTLGRPEADVSEWPSDTDFSGDLVVTVEVDVRPEFEIPTYDGLTVEVEPAEVTDADVDTALDELRTRFGTLVSVDRPAKTGDFVQIDLSATINDEEVDSASGVSYEVGSGELLEGMDEAVESLTAGENTTFSSPLLGGEHQGENAEVAVTVSAVKERELPEADDDFAQIASEFDTIGELRESLVEQVKSQKTFGQGTEARTKAVDLLLEAVEIPVSEKLIEAEVERHLESESRLEDDEHRAEVSESSEKTFRTQLLLDAIVEKENVQVSQEELTQYLIQGASQYGMEPGEFIKVLDENGQIPQMVGEVARNKAIAVVLGKANVVDTAGASVDLTGFLPPAEDDSAESVAVESVAIDSDVAEGDSEDAEEAPVADEEAK